MQVNTEWEDYEIIATGNGEKLERWGEIKLLRPDPQVIWPASRDLSKEKNLSMQQISKKINRDKSTTTVLIKKLEKLNLVKSTSSLQDSRIKLIELTSQGKTYNEQTLQISNELKEKFFKNLSAEEIASLENTLSKISSNFE